MRYGAIPIVRKTGGMYVLQLLSLNHYSPLPSNSLHSAYTRMKWAQDLTDLSCVPQGSTTLSLTWTMTRNGPGLEALSQTGSALMELTTMVSTMLWIGTQSHRACFSELSNSILIVAPSWWCSISGRSLLGSTPGTGSTPSARGSWSRTGHGTGLPWTTSSFTIRRPNFEKLTNDACCRMQPSTFCRLLGWALLYRNIAHPREADIVRFRIMVLRACMFVSSTSTLSTLS